LVGGPAVAARLAPKPATPAYVQYDKPPLMIDGDAFGIGEVEGFRPRFRVYDYGVLSVALTRPFCGNWADLVALGQTLIENVELEQRAEALSRAVVERLKPSISVGRSHFLSEDYVVYEINELEAPQSAEELLASHGTDI